MRFRLRQSLYFLMRSSPISNAVLSGTLLALHRRERAYLCTVFPSCACVRVLFSSRFWELPFPFSKILCSLQSSIKICPSVLVHGVLFHFFELSDLELSFVSEVDGDCGCESIEYRIFREYGR